MMSASAKRAEAAAKAKFQEYLAGRPVREDFVPRLSLGYMREGRDWVFTILLADEKADGSKGLYEDLIQPRPEHVGTIRVDEQTGEASIEEWIIPIWDDDSGA